MPALRVIGLMISSEDDTITLHVLEMGLLNNFEELLKSEHNYIIKEACWLLSNVLCSGRYCIKKVDEKEKIIPLLIKLSVTEGYPIKNEALFCLVNMF